MVTAIISDNNAGYRTGKGTIGTFFPRATNFANGLKRKFKEKFFTNLHFSAVCKPCHNRISANFQCNKFRGSPKIHEIHKICSPRKKAPYGNSHLPTFNNINSKI